MALSTYSDLVSEVGDFLNRSDLTGKIPTFIRLFEAQMNRILRNSDMEQTFTRTTVSGTLSYAINARVRELREVYIESDDDLLINYTVTGESIVFEEDPGDGTTLYYSGYTTLSGLSDSTTTNWLLDDHPDAYYFGTLSRAYAYLKDDERAAEYQSVVDGIVAEIRREANQKRVPAGPLQSAPAVRE